MAENRRGSGNVFKVAKLRRRYYLFMLVGGLILSVVFGTLMLDRLREIQTAVGQAGLASEPVLAIYDHLFFTAMLFFFTFIGYTAVTTVLVLYLEGRIGGASVAILDVLEKYKEGDYTYDRKLRDGDELAPIMDSIKALGASLQKK